MQLLPTQSLRITTGQAADIDMHSSFTKHATDPIPDALNKASTTATDTTIVPASGAGVVRVHDVYASNKDATDSCDVTVTILDSGADPDVQVYKTTLLAGEVLQYEEGHGWFVHTSLAGVKDALAKFWVKAAGDGSAIRDSYNVTSITDTGAGRLTVTIATDFLNANWCCNATCERNSTSLTVTNLKYLAIRQSTQAAGSVEIECWDGTSSTAVQEDPAEYHVLGFGDQ